jgi:hypothetical protein
MWTVYVLFLFLSSPPSTSAQSMPKNILNNAGHASFIVLEPVVAAADACPPLKSVAGGSLYIAKAIKVHCRLFIILSHLLWRTELQIKLGAMA